MDKRTKRWLIICSISAIMIILLQNVEALPLWRVQYNESLCSCTAGTGSSFNYSDYFNQGLNTTNDVNFSTINLSSEYYNMEINGVNGYMSISEPINDILSYSRYFDGMAFSQRNISDNSLLSLIQFQSATYYNWDSNNVDEYCFWGTYDKILCLDANNYKVKFAQLSGSGSAFACLDENGTLFRSAVACS